MSPPLKPLSAGAAGTGLFATRAIKAEEAILQEERPLLAVLDSPRLKEACSWCFLYTGETDDDVELKVCTGCKILRFCGKACQSAAWKHSHKLECKIYSKLYPNVLPNTARMVIQLLVRKKAGTLPQAQWNSFLSLQHHVEDFKKLQGSGTEIYENLQLMARAAQEYSGTGEDLGLVETMAGRLLINTLTLPTPLYTPLGLGLSLPISILNHSCSPNCIISFSSSTLTLRALRPIPSSTELTISYIDTSFSPSTRQAELLSRYFFHCACPACTSSQTLALPDPPPDLSEMPPSDLKSLEDSATELLSQAAASPPPRALVHLGRAINLFSRHPSFPAYRQPLARIRSDLVLQLLACGHWVPALLQSLISRFSADATSLPEAAHPVRVARTWVLAKLCIQLEAVSSDKASGHEGAAARELARHFEVDWRLVVWVLVGDVEAMAGRSHGVGSVLWGKARAAKAELKKGMEAAGIEGVAGEVGEETWSRLERLAKEGWEWWKTWEGSRRKGERGLVKSGAEDDGVGTLIRSEM